jgi:pimeloyl-ACP methyl ester carboxylesterase
METGLKSNSRCLLLRATCCALSVGLLAGCAGLSGPALPPTSPTVTVVSTAPLALVTPSPAVTAASALPAATASPPTRPTATVAPTTAPPATLTVDPITGPLATPAGPRQQAQSLEVRAELAGMTQTVRVDYLLYLPREYGVDANQRWPLILFLHGSEERGDDIELVKRNGLPKLLEQGLDLPCVVVSPQCPTEKYWWTRAAVLSALLDGVQSAYAVDPERVYLTGFSLGAYGAWALALREPQRFAALVPVAGGCDFASNDIPANLCDLRAMPVWAFHGALDTTVAPGESQRAVDALQACDGDVRFTLYPEEDHAGACARAYSDPELYVWLLSQQR